MTPALTTAQHGLTTASKRFGAASAAVVAAAAYQAAGAAATTRAVPPPDGGQGGAFNGGAFAGTGAQGGLDAGAAAGRPPLPEGLVALLQDAGGAPGRSRYAGLPTLEEASVESLLAQRAFEANLRSFQAADRQLGDTLDLLA